MSEDFPNNDGDVHDQDYTMDDVSSANQVSSRDDDYQPHTDQRGNPSRQKKRKKDGKTYHSDDSGRSKSRGYNRRGSHQPWQNARGGRGRGRGRGHRGRGRGRGGRGRGRGRGRKHRSNNGYGQGGYGDNDDQSGYGPSSRKSSRRGSRMHPYGNAPRGRYQGNNSREEVNGQDLEPSPTCLPACHELGKCLCRQTNNPEQQERLVSQRRDLSQIDRFTKYMLTTYGQEMPQWTRNMPNSVFDDQDPDYKIENNKYQDLNIPWVAFYEIMEREKKRLFDEHVQRWEPTGGRVKLQDCRFPDPQQPPLAHALVSESAVYTKFGEGTPITPIMPVPTPIATPRTPIGPGTTEDDLYGRSDDFNNYLGLSATDLLYAPVV